MALGCHAQIPRSNVSACMVHARSTPMVALHAGFLSWGLKHRPTVALVRACNNIYHNTILIRNTPTHCSSGHSSHGHLLLKLTPALLEVDTCSNRSVYWEPAQIQIAQLEVDTCSTRHVLNLLNSKWTLAPKWQLEMDTCSSGHVPNTCSNVFKLAQFQMDT